MDFKTINISFEFITTENINNFFNPWGAEGSFGTNQVLVSLLEGKDSIFRFSIMFSIDLVDDLDNQLNRLQ